jgi:hypothetical protein
MNKLPSPTRLMNPLPQRFRCTTALLAPPAVNRLSLLILTEVLSPAIPNGNPAILYLYARFACFRRTEPFYYFTNYWRPVP